LNVVEVRSVHAALRILDEVAAHEPVGVSELARLSGLPKSSVQRTLRTLHSAGWIHRSGAETTRWGLTTHMLRVGQRAAGGLSLRNVAVPVMEGVRSRTQETVHLAVPEQDQIMLIERLDSPQPVRTFIPLGMAAPITASANGKAILATRPRDEQEVILERGLPACTPVTVTDRGELLAELDSIRQRGYATCNEEWRTGVSAVAAAITAGGSRAVASISVSTPANRMSREHEGRYGELLKEAVQQISSTLERGTSI